MTGDTLVPYLTSLLEPLAETEGLELVAVEVVGERRAPIVRILLDREGGITIDAIAEASHWIVETLDGVRDLPAGYTLETSSPGIDRPLRKLSDFERFIGSKAKVTTRQLIGRRKQFTGTIVAVVDDAIHMDVDETEYTIPFAEVDKARLRAEIDFDREAQDGI